MLPLAVLTVLVATNLIAGTTEQELIKDVHFQQGFRALGTHPLRQVRGAVLRGNLEATVPAWELCEWWCTESLMGTEQLIPAPGMYRYEVQSHAVTVDSGAGELRLALNSTRERNGRARTAKEDWPHLLLQQTLATETSPCPPLGKLRALPFQVEARVIRDVRSTSTEYDPSLHAAQFLIYFTVVHRASGDFLWFGITLYDDRYPHPGLSTFPGDAGSAGLGKFIYSPDTRVFTAGTLHGGEWVKYEADLLPLMKAGLERAWAEGFLLGKGREDARDLQAYSVRYMNLGIELPGLHDFEGHLRGLSLKAQY